MASFSARREDHFKKKLSKINGPPIPFRFCKIGLRNTLFIFGRKNGRFSCLFVLFCLFVAILSDFGLLFFDYSRRIYSPSNLRFIQKTKKIKCVPITII